jgi:dGTPase
MRKGNEPGLASYAMSVSKSLGRRFPEPPHPYRNEYERDRDRIIHSRAFRRLENKTQVFTRRYSDHFRNRLTHTLEVTQISRTVAKALRLNADLVETLALVHDVGHPPFGHAGETELDRLMEEQGDRFDHNLHALRIVEQFEQKYADFPGLNLTFEVREGIVKHSRDYDAEQYPDLIEYRLNERPPLEAQLIDVADEIAYNCADLDDGYEAKLLTLDQIREGVPLFGRLLRPVERKHPKALEKLKFNEALKGLMDSLVTDLIEATRGRLERMKMRTVDDLRAAPSRVVGPSLRISRENQTLKAFLRDNLYSHREIQAERKKIVRCVAQMFEFYMDHPRSLPPFYFGKTKEEPAYRVVCDYIAGMTDNYLAELHRKFIEG